MSLNKFRDASVKKEWMNINCNEIKATVADIDGLDIKQLTIEGDALPQLKVSPITGTNQSAVSLAGGVEQLVYFTNEGTFATGRIVSLNSSNTFSINPETRVNVSVEAPVHLFKTTTQQNPTATHVSLYAKTGSEELYTKDSTGAEKQLATVLPTEGNVKTVWTSLAEQNLPSASTNPTPQSVLDFVSAGVGSLVIPANSIVAGTSYQVDFSGLFNIAVISSLELYMFLNGVEYSNTPITPLLDGTGIGNFSGNFYLSFEAPIAGSSRAVPSGTVVFADPVNHKTLGLSFGTISSFPVNAPITIDVRIQWTVPDGANYTTTRNSYLMKMY